MFSISLATILKITFAGLAIYAYIILITRMAGKRTFAKMGSFDFAITIAMGSILADAVNKPSGSFMPALISLGLLALLQVVFAKLRTKSSVFEHTVTNTPVLLMRDGQIYEENLKKCLVTKSDLMAKLREANVLQFSEVKAVVFETTGDISVLHGREALTIDKALLDGVED
ncbi:DUF421 domain-containing protein [Pseudozobellia thermophila]|uniref:YetF C-terminal domain-containing protein n=1 Tax=Pseudozobellia thermophila TaxID=192903 RepID=A0A1M6AWD4_9FLAO|nr:YetF domain-containing protein [Pseudozobellia thermophila]SHI40859.1 Protein of unknown function [Pseudozobellia thermophila]